MTSPEFRNLQCTVHAIAGAIQARDRVLATELLDDVPEHLQGPLALVACDFATYQSGGAASSPNPRRNQ